MCTLATTSNNDYYGNAGKRVPECVGFRIKEAWVWIWGSTSYCVSLMKLFISPPVSSVKQEWVGGAD